MKEYGGVPVKVEGINCFAYHLSKENEKVHYLEVTHVFCHVKFLNFFSRKINLICICGAKDCRFTFVDEENGNEVGEVNDEMSLGPINALKS